MHASRLQRALPSGKSRYRIAGGLRKKKTLFLGRRVQSDTIHSSRTTMEADLFVLNKQWDHIIHLSLSLSL